MAGNTYGTLFRVTTFGESHGKAIGAVIDGIESRLPLDLKEIAHQLNRRRPGQSSLTTNRNESDEVEIISGMYEGLTTGQPLTLLIYNKDQRSADYSALENVFRPGHANFSYQSKWGIHDPRGGGRASARETAARVAAGAIANQILKKRGIRIYAYVLQVGSLIAKAPNPEWIDQWPDGTPNLTRCPDPTTAKAMEELILHYKKEGDSIGGIIQCCIEGVPAGLGEPLFDRLDALLAHAFLSIPATKGVDFGIGFDGIELPGSLYRDPILPSCQATEASNRAGGVLGGISNGLPILARILFKPPSSVKAPIATLDLQGNPTTVSHEGRHDPCVLPRAVPIVEAMAALTLIDLLYRHQARLPL